MYLWVLLKIDLSVHQCINSSNLCIYLTLIYVVYHGTIFENNSQESAILGLYLTNILLSVSTVIDLEFFLSPESEEKN